MKGKYHCLLVSRFTSLDSNVSLHTNNSILCCLVKSSHVKLETSSTGIISPIVSVLWLVYEFK